MNAPLKTDKRMGAAQVVAQLKDGKTLGIGGRGNCQTWVQGAWPEAGL